MTSTTSGSWERLLKLFGIHRRDTSLIGPARIGSLGGRPTFWVGMTMLAIPLAMALFGPWLAAHDPYSQSRIPFSAPSVEHWMGTDQLGRDLFARIADGGRRSLGGAMLALALAVVSGIIVGAFAAVAGRQLGTIVMRGVDAMNGIPPLVIPIALVGALGASYANLLLAVIIGYVPAYAKIAHSLAGSLRQRPDVISAQMMGVGRVRIAITHVAKTVATQMLVITMLDIGSAVTALAGLSFLGLGAQAPTPEWGVMLNDGQNFFTVAPWLLWFPASLVTLLILGANLAGEALRDASAESQGEVARGLGIPGKADKALTQKLLAENTERYPATISVPTHCLTVTNLHVLYPGGGHAVRGVDLVIRHGCTVALVGESGCGKSTIADAIVGLLPARTVVRGQVLLGSNSTHTAPLELLRLSEPERQAIRGTRIGYVTQDPFAAFDPIRNVEHHVTAAWRVHGLRPQPGQVCARLSALGINNATRQTQLRPHQWSGGMLQRASIAAAGALRPDLIVADEPTSALDADLAFATLAALQADARAILLITHNLTLAARVADYVYVLYAGRVVEHGAAQRICTAPTHPYTAALLAATPQGRTLPTPLPGSPPSPFAQPHGCAFAPRCRHVQSICTRDRPALIDGVACHWIPQ